MSTRVLCLMLLAASAAAAPEVSAAQQNPTNPQPVTAATAKPRVEHHRLHALRHVLTAPAPAPTSGTAAPRWPRH